jgi:hypothetical protein
MLTWDPQLENPIKYIIALKNNRTGDAAQTPAGYNAEPARRPVRPSLGRSARDRNSPK